MKTTHNKRSSRSKKQSVPVEGTSTLPNHLKKEGCIYINGIIDSGAHGFYHVNLENKMNALCTARRMEALKLSLLPGDDVVIEIPANSLNPTERLNGRIVWRIKKTYN